MTSWMSPKAIMRSFSGRVDKKFAALFALILLPISGYAAQPPDCSGYPEKRVFLSNSAIKSETALK